MYVSLIQVSLAHQQSIQTYTIIINSAVLDTLSDKKNSFVGILSSLSLWILTCQGNKIEHILFNSFSCIYNF